MPGTYPDKVLQVVSALGKFESTIGTPVTLSPSTDAFQLQLDNNGTALVDDDWEFDGSLGPSPSSLNEVRPVPPSGHGGNAPLPHRWKGAGVAYAASGAGRPHNADFALQVSGFDATTDTTTSSEKVTYTLTQPGTAPKTATMEYWEASVLGTSNLEKRAMSAVLGDLTMAFTDKSPPKWTLTAKGAYTDPTEAAFTLPTYPHASIIEPLASDFTFTWNSISGLKVYEGKFTLGRDISQANIPQNNGGTHQGFVAGGFKGTTFEMLIQAPKLVTADFYAARKNATAGAFLYKCGSTQYNRYTCNGATVIPVAVKREARGPIQCVRVTFGFFASSAGATDAVNFVFD